MQLHLINGFLGAGKTTAIIAAAQNLIRQGQTIGIVTNDKGQFQVDAAFFNSQRIPTRQVTGGCFRCSFDEFEKMIAQIQVAEAPDVIFAESVGSCVDLVNTIFGPLQNNHQLQVERSTYSVFADIRLFRYWINQIPLPFSESIQYLFEKQIEESKVLILNKADLLSGDQAQEILAAAQAQFPEKIILSQNSLMPASLNAWLTALQDQTAFPTPEGFTVNYRQYKEGEAQMAWFDQRFELAAADPTHIQPAAEALIRRLLDRLQAQKVMVGHIKFFWPGISAGHKLSFTTADFIEQAPGQAPGADWPVAVPFASGDSLTLTLNARLAMDAHDFAAIVQDVVQEVMSAASVQIHCQLGASYHPQIPIPIGSIL